MKQKLIALTTPLLTACMALSLWLSWDFASVFFFGEYPYPTKED